MNHFTDTYVLGNGLKIPCIGFGTYQAAKNGSADVIATAIECGYRYFDTASLYQTERALGEAIKQSGIPREDFFLVSKVWIDEMGYEETKEAFARTLSRLQTDYLDLYLIHWPKSPTNQADWKEKVADTWRAMEELYAEGKIKGLGVCNFLPHHLDHLLSVAKVQPLVDQMEIHPGYSQERAVAYCFEKGIRPQAWSPMGRSEILSNPILLSFAEKYGKSVAQICMRFVVQKGIIALPKASSAAHMKENQDVFDFELTDEDLKILECMPQDTWLGEHPDFDIPTVACSRTQ